MGVGCRRCWGTEDMESGRCRLGALWSMLGPPNLRVLGPQENFPEDILCARPGLGDEEVGRSDAKKCSRTHGNFITVEETEGKKYTRKLHLCERVGSCGQINK